MRQRRPTSRSLSRVPLALAVSAVALLQPSGAAQLAALPVRPVQSQPSGNGSDDVAIRLIQQDTTVDPAGDFSAFLEVDGAPEGSDLAIDIYPVIDDRELLDDALTGDLRNSAATFPVVALPPGPGPVQTGFVINLYESGEESPGGGWAKRLDDPGVYPLRVRLRGPDTQTLDTLVTFLVRGPGGDDDFEPVPLALVPELSAGTSPRESLDQAGDPLDPELTNSIETLVATFGAHPDVPASFVVPADLARRMEADGDPDDPDDDPDGGAQGGDGSSGGGGPEESTTTEADDGGSATSGSITTTSTAGQEGSGGGLVEQFRAALAGDHRELLTTTFVDVDPAELVAAGLTAELTRQHELGFRDLADILEPPVGDTWLASRRLDPGTVEALAATGVTNLLVPLRSIEAPVPSLPFRIEGAGSGSRATVIDPGLTTDGGTDPTLAAHRLIGHAIARSMLGDGAPQVISVPLPGSVEDVAALDSFLALLADHDQFVQPGTVTELMRSSLTAPDPAVLAAPDISSSGSYPRDLRATRQLVDAYASMIPDRPDLAAAVSEQLSRSATAGLSTEARAAVVGGVRAQVEARFAAVSIPGSDRVTLGARDAQFPLVISSQSDVPLRVIVDLTSASDRLTVKQDRIEVVLDSDRTVVPVRVHSRSPGDTPVKITVSTLDGAVILSEGSYSVRSTAVSGVGLLLTVGAGLFLALWWGRHFVRARRSRARHAR